jgi:hypothetical protein
MSSDSRPRPTANSVSFEPALMAFAKLTDRVIID